jgi:hypothetical protein
MYGLHSTTGDAYGAQWVVDAFQKCGIKYTKCDRVRSDIYLDALPLFTSGRVRLLDNKRLITQFAQLERKTGLSGKDSVNHPDRGHDDVCNAAALALITRRNSCMMITDEMVAKARTPHYQPCAFS